MTNKEYVISQLEANLRERGENASSTRMLKRQLASIEWAERNLEPLRTHQFQVGARGEHLPNTRRRRRGGGKEARGGERQSRSSVERAQRTPAVAG